MDIKYVLGVLVVILLLGNVFLIYEMQSSSDNVVMIGDKSLNLPKNYTVTKIDISTGSTSIPLVRVGNADIDSVVNDYNNKFSENFTISVNEFDSKLPAKKTVATSSDNSSIIKYWFDVDGTVYQMQVSNKNTSEFDNIVKNMLNSVS